MDAKQDWNFCPPEILCVVLKHLCSRQLLNCMLVSRRWKAIADDYIESHGLWQSMVGEEMDNHGVTYRRKSVLGWKNMLMNSILWTFCRSAKVKRIHTYKLNNIQCIHMYHDRLIIKNCEHKIEYYNVTNFDSVKVIDGPCLPFFLDEAVDFTENDSMLLSLYQKGALHLYGKTHPCSPSSAQCKASREQYMDRAFLYKLEDNICYVVDSKFIVWACIWTNNKWDVQLVGRYYSSANDKAAAIHVYNNRVYIVTNLGTVLCDCPYTKSFQKMFNCDIEDYKCPYNWVLFHKHDIVVSIKSDPGQAGPGLSLHTIRTHNHLRFECPGMTCAIEHGEVLLIGYSNGKIMICVANETLDKGGTGGKPDVLIFIQDYDMSIQDPCIIALEVFEDRLSHHLLVATKDHVSQLHLTYPDRITELYE